jgi:hypothetical protein
VLGKWKHSGNTNRCKQSHVRGFDSQKQTNKAIYCRSHISSNTLRPCPRNHHKSTVRTRKTRALDSVTQEQSWLPPTIISNRTRQERRQKKTGQKRATRQQIFTGAPCFTESSSSYQGSGTRSRAKMVENIEERWEDRTRAGTVENSREQNQS